MTIEEYIKREHELLEKFKTYWSEQHGKNPEYFPNEMSSGDWDEQFWIWPKN